MTLSVSQFRTYHVKPLPIILCDTMGLEESTGAGLNVEDIGSLLRGHIPDRYQVSLLKTILSFFSKILIMFFALLNRIILFESVAFFNDIYLLMCIRMYVRL